MSYTDANVAGVKTPPSPELEAGVKPSSEQRGDAPAETGGPQEPDPTRYGDWERKGRCIDF